jgi:hypothetical protein
MPFLGTTGGGSVKQYGGQANLGYFIKNSLRTRSSASAYLNRTFGTPTSNYIFTWSGWVKRGVLSTDHTLFGVAAGTSGNTGSTPRGALSWNADNTLNIFANDGSSTFLTITTSAVFRDPAAWYHIVCAVDTTQATNTNRVFIYINGVLQTVTGTYPNQNVNTILNGTSSSKFHSIGMYANLSQYFDGYLAEVNFVDGQALTPSSFGKTDAATGQWIPKKYAGTYGNNGFYLKFADASAATAAAIGKDSSGNGNNWTPNNISVTAGATYDAMIDAPTRSGAASNYCTLNPLAKGLQFPSMADGNLRTGDINVGNYHQTVGGTVAVNTGKWYWEITLNGTTYNSRSLGIAFASKIVTASDNAMWNTSTALTDYRSIMLINSTTVQPCRSIAGTVTTATNITLPSTMTGTSVFMVAMDVTTGAIWFGLDGTWLKSATTAEIIAGTTTNAVYTDIGSPSDSWTPALYSYLGSATGYGYGWIANFGQRPFVYTPPTGFKSLNTFNLP